MLRKTALCIAAAALACGQKSAPSSGAVLEGNVQGATALTVAVPGSRLSTTTDAAGHFALVDVPEGTSDLHFTGAGVDAGLHLSSSMSRREHRLISVSVSGHDAAEHPEQEGQELHGAIDSIAAPNFTLAGGQVVATTTATVFRKDGAALAFSDLTVGESVEVEGAPQSDGSLLARTVSVEQDDEGESEGGNQQAEDVQFQGALAAIDGATLTVGTTTVHTDAVTRIEKNDQVIAVGGLALNDALSVEGALQADGSVLAKEIKVLSAAEQQDIEVEGAVAAVSAGSFTIGTTVIVADAASLATIAVGDVVEVEAALQADGSLVAVQIEKVEQPEMNEVEVQGPIQALTADSITVQGKAFTVDSTTEIRKDGNALPLSSLQVGQNAQVRGEAAADGSLHATRISL